MFLGQEYRTRWGALDRRRMNAATEAFFRDSWQLDINPRRLIRDLSLAERKLVQIARALIDGAAKLVVFDEPTAPLEAQEASLVSSAILRLREQGSAFSIFPTTSTRSPPSAIAARYCVTARSLAIPTGRCCRTPTR